MLHVSADFRVEDKDELEEKLAAAPTAAHRDALSDGSLGAFGDAPRLPPLLCGTLRGRSLRRRSRVRRGPAELSLKIPWSSRGDSLDHVRGGNLGDHPDHQYRNNPAPHRSHSRTPPVEKKVTLTASCRTAS